MKNDINLGNYKDKLLFIPLGGAGEIGANISLYHYNGDWIIVDLGLGFADQNSPGIDITLPNIEFVIKNY